MGPVGPKKAHLGFFRPSQGLGKGPPRRSQIRRDFYKGVENLTQYVGDGGYPLLDKFSLPPQSAQNDQKGTIFS